MSTPEDTAVAVGIPPEEGKFCADCKFLLGVRDNKYDADKWKCCHPNNSKWKPADLVTGIKEREFKFNIRELRYLNTVDSAAGGVAVCGPQGRWYEKYEKPEYNYVKGISEDAEGRPAIVEKVRLPEYKPQTVKPSALKNLQLGRDL